MKTFDVDDIESGSVFECKIFTESGQRLANAYTPLDEEQLESLRKWNITTIQAEEEPMPAEVKQSYIQQTDDEEMEADAGQGEDNDTPEVEADYHRETESARSVSDGLKSQVKSSYDEALERTQDLIKPISKGLVKDSRRIFKAIHPLVESIWHLPRTVLFLLADQSMDPELEYINLYSLNTSIYSMLIARQLDMDRDEARLVGTAGLVHDIGMLKIPQHIRKKEGDFSDEERDVMESHPKRGARILSQIDNLEQSVVRTAAEHHERYDGGGYPDRLTGDDIHYHARIVNLAMTYTAMTQPRFHRARRDSIESIQTILDDEKDQFDPEVIEAFLLLVGIYPVGTFVELESGAHGMVVKPCPEDQYNPTVKVFTDFEGNEIDEPYLVELHNDRDEIKNVLLGDIMGYSSLEMA